MQKVFMLVFIAVISISHVNAENHVLEKPRYESNNKNARNYFLTYSDFDFDWLDFTVPLPSISYSGESYRAFSEFYKPLVAFWDEDMQEWYDFEQAIPHLATSKYLSVEATFYSNQNHVAGVTIITAVTIDLEEQKEVFLCDLIDVNDEFIQLLQESQIINSDIDASLFDEFGDPTDFTKFSLEEIQTMIDAGSIPGDRSNILYKSTFFLAPGRLYLVYFEQMGRGIRAHEVYVELSDIEKFLKVEKW